MMAGIATFTIVDARIITIAPVIPVMVTSQR